MHQLRFWAFFSYLVVVVVVAAAAAVAMSMMLDMDLLGSTHCRHHRSLGLSWF